MKMFDSQKSPFAAKVFFFTPLQIRGILSALLAKHYRAANKEDKDDEDDDQQGSKVESFGEMRDTLAAFTALFCDQEQFESEDSASNYLQQAKSENDSKILEELVGWAVDVVNRFLEGNDFVTIEKSTPGGATMGTSAVHLPGRRYGWRRRSIFLDSCERYQFRTGSSVFERGCRLCRFARPLGRKCCPFSQRHQASQEMHTQNCGRRNWAR
jgi:hypothetical protein